MRNGARRVAIAVGMAAAVAGAGEIGFLEDFALAKDREEALKLLIPGTEDHYYYRCLNFQNKGELKAVETELVAWHKRYGRTRRVVEIENRQALLLYEKEPRKSLEHIRQRLGVQFNHQRQVMGQKLKLPTRLDPRSSAARR